MPFLAIQQFARHNLGKGITYWVDKMAFAYNDEVNHDYACCGYGASKMLFRGPERGLDRPYVAVLGGTEAFGKFIAKPYPALIEAATGLRVINLGAVNAGVDLFLQEEAVRKVAAQAEAVIVQVLGAQNLSNRFYAVHPLRNDRFIAARQPLRALYPEVDFTEFHFTRHMLLSLQRRSASRFDLIVQELRKEWVIRMRLLLESIEMPTVLLWLAGHAPPGPGIYANLEGHPPLVDAGMIEQVRAKASTYLEIVRSPDNLRGRPVGGGPAQRSFPAAAVHHEVARCVVSALGRLRNE